MLILFDIDATLIRTEGAGIRAMLDAGRELFSPQFSADGVPFAGRLDPLILADLLRVNGQPVTAGNITAMREAYRRHLGARLAPGVGRALPGVQPLLARLGACENLTIGLLTGNFPETGAMKLTACGIDVDWFTIRVWGDDSPHDPPARDHLPAVGMRRYAETRGRSIEPRHVVIIGDTPHDAACALAHGCRALGVATGQFSTTQLLEAGAHHALPDLSETEAVVAWLRN